MIREQVARAMGARPWRERGQTWFTLALPALALALVAALLYQTAQTALSNRRIVREAVRTHASVAAWELSREANHRLLFPALGAFLVAHGSSRGGLGGLTAAELGAAFRYPRCRCLGGVRTYFRVDLRDGATTLHHRVRSPDSALAWVADTIRARVGDPAHLHSPVILGAPRTLPGASSRGGRSTVVVRGGGMGALAPRDATAPQGFGMAAGSRGGEPSLILFAVVRDSAGRPVTALGVETEPAAFLGPALAGIARDVRLLPPALAGPLPNDSIFAIAVTARDGRPLYASGALDAEASAREVLEPQLGGLVLRAAVRPSQAGRLVVGGVPASRIPLQLGMALVAAGLLGGSLVLLRREQELNRMRAGFVTGVSHELRTPLAQILLFAEILAAGDEADAAERRRFAGIVADEAQRLTRLVETLLEFSRPAGAAGAQRVPVELGEEAERAMEAVRPLCRRSATELRLDGPEAVWAVADPLALRHILLNLIDNAAKYGPDGQTITVRAFRCGERACIAVDDEGAGVPDAERELIFRPFHRMPRHAEGQTGGSGIGLTVAREMAYRQDGHLRAETAPGGGARFVVELPGAERGG